MLDLRDALDQVAVERKLQSTPTITLQRNLLLKARGWPGGLATFNAALHELRTACYVVLASLSGCRNHEIVFCKSNACYQTENDDGEKLWWMRSRSTKTDEAKTEWMIPEAAVRALNVMDRWARPSQARIRLEITERRAANPRDPEIATAQRHREAIFLGVSGGRSGLLRTLTSGQMNTCLKTFAKKRGLDWPIATHQFRRKFANYAARSQFGDLRYLREHFKHWSLDMTLGYVLNETQEMQLYVEIKDELDNIKEDVTSLWLRPSEPLAGNYGRNITAWRDSTAVNVFRSRAHMIRSIAHSTAIRSNGHAWCTADDNQCIGNGELEATRCSGCDNAVIGRLHLPVYQQLYEQLKDLLRCSDMGESGMARVQRDLERCRSVFVSLGVPLPESAT